MYTIMMTTPDNRTPRRLGAWHPSVKGVSLQAVTLVLQHYCDSWPNNCYWVVAV